MALSKPAAMDEQVCTATQALFTLAKGKRRIQVEGLIPEEFNRFDDPLKGSRVMEIIYLLLIKPGFADYKYECAWSSVLMEKAASSWRTSQTDMLQWMLCSRSVIGGYIMAPIGSRI